MPKLRSILPAAFAFALGAVNSHAQLTPLQDPANLAGERVSPQDPADTLPLNHGAPALQQLLAKLRTRASLMLIVAHPDDEDGGLLTYESRGQGARVAMLTLTRGEGGQNLMSADFDDALGLIRTQELLAADRYFGVDQFFGTEVDFGFSKTKEESFQKWTHDRVLYDAVRAVRLYRPLVIASVFVGGPTDGHGQHQVAGEIAQEVFVAAADPNVFPDMIAEGLLPWAPLKVYARVPFSRVTPEGMYDYATGRTVPTRFHNYVTGADSTAVPTATVLIHEGDKPSDPTLAAAMGGDTFLQFARKGLALQKTQIGLNARLAPAGAFDAGYTLMATRLGCINTKSGCPTLSDSGKGGFSTPNHTTEQSLFDGIDTSLRGIATLAPDAPANLKVVLKVNLAGIDHSISEAQLAFNPNHPELTASRLREGMLTTNNLIAEINKATPDALPLEQKLALLHELRIKRTQINNALILATGVVFSAELSSDPPRPDGSLLTGAAKNMVVRVKCPGDVHLRQVAVEALGSAIKHLEPLNKFGNSQVITFDSGLDISTDTPATQPYFSRHTPEQPYYDLSIQNLRNSPATPASLKAIGKFDFEGVDLETQSTFVASGTKATISIVPKYSVMLTPSVGVDPISKPRDVPMALTASVRSESSGGGLLTLNLPESCRAEPSSFLIPSAPAGAKKMLSFSLTTDRLAAGKHYEVKAVVTTGTSRYTESYRPVGYPGLPYTNFYTPATYRATAVDLHTAPNLRVAYLPGTGDPVPDFLPNLGITPTLLTLKDLNSANLEKYDAILLGVRAYAAHPELAGPGSQPLLDYAKQGGVVILQYNTARFGDAEAPFPIDVPGDPAHNVVEEAQPVTLLHPEAPLLTWPNKITSADFDNWVAERGHGFAATWSPSYTPLLETHDVGQDPQQGGLLLARTGKGAYIYCALALYRQLPEGVPGAYRLLANLLSYAKNPAFAK